jgi:hypothetical protein
LAGEKENRAEIKDRFGHCPVRGHLLIDREIAGFIGGEALEFCEIPVNCNGYFLSAAYPASGEGRGHR